MCCQTSLDFVSYTARSNIDPVVSIVIKKNYLIICKLKIIKKLTRYKIFQIRNMDKTRNEFWGASQFCKVTDMIITTIRSIYFKNISFILLIIN